MIGYLLDPARGVEIASFPDMNTDDAERAIQAAKNALPEWSQKTAKVSGQYASPPFSLFFAFTLRSHLG